MPLSNSDIGRLLKQQPITDEWPWNSGDESVIHKHIKDIVAELCQKLRLKDRSEYGHYGSGYASYVDCWLYREDAEFRVATGDWYRGLVILFSTLSKHYVLGEGEKSWHAKGGSTYLPSFAFVDKLDRPAVASLERGVSRILASRGLVRQSAEDLSDFLPRDTSVPTNLGDPPWRHFDALFYWED